MNIIVGGVRKIPEDVFTIAPRYVARRVVWLDVRKMRDLLSMTKLVAVRMARHELAVHALACFWKDKDMLNPPQADKA